MTDSEKSKLGGGAGALRRVEPLLGEVEELMRRLLAQRGGELLGGMASEHLATGGKRIRARLALAATEALGGRAAQAVGWAAACELFHNGTLVHDDLQDGDRVRRGQPTVWARHGAEQAINAGDLLLLVPYLAVGEVPGSGELRWQLCRVLAQMSTTVIRGQAYELAMTREARTGRQDYLDTVVGKTSGLFELPVLGAALVAGRDAEQAQRLSAPFRAMGVLFQMQDDVLDLYGNKGREAPGSDLREGKVSTLVVEHLALHPEDRAWLLELLRSPRESTSDADVSAAITRLREGGALAAVCAQIETTALQARTHEALHGEPAMQELLTELVELMLRPIQHVLDDQRS